MIKKGLFNLITLIFICGFFSFVLVNQATEVYKLTVEEKHLIKALEEELAKEESLKSREDFEKTDAFIEQIARERLGYIKNDEVIFIRR